MSGQSAKRRKTTAMALPGVPGIDSLPPELLETIFGLLDVGTLCTARLVCAEFRGAASRCLHSVELSVETLRSRPETTLNNFPNLSRVGLVGMEEDDLRMLAKSPVAAAITHLQAVKHWRLASGRARNAAGFPLPPLPNLTSLTVSYPLRQPLRAFFPQSLRELDLRACVTYRTANLVAELTNLTRLRIDVTQMVAHDLPQKVFKGVTALTALQRLEIHSKLSVIPFVAELTLLTHLQFNLYYASGDPAHLASLSRLHRLVHLGVVGFSERLERQVLTSIEILTGLRSLDLHSGSRQVQPSAFETVCMAPFSELTALKLGLKLCHRGSARSFLERFNLEALRDLSFSPGIKLDRNGVAALRRATGLTQLTLWQVNACVGRKDLGEALRRMSRLRELSLGHPDAHHVTYSLKAIAVLTELTRLCVTGRGISANAALDVCLGLKELRVLRLIEPPRPEFFPSAPPAPADPAIRKLFFAIAKLPELRNFVIIRGGLRESVRARVSAERQAKGWPPLHLGIRASL